MHNNFVTSLYIGAEECEAHNLELNQKYAAMEANECRWEELMTEDAQLILVAFGTPARVAETAMNNLRAQGRKVGLLRPITLWPFPTARIRELAGKSHVKAFLDVEMNLGQMLDDVNLAVSGQKPVKFYGRCGGAIPHVDEVEQAVQTALEEVE